jgi:hypothetical protein
MCTVAGALGALGAAGSLYQGVAARSAARAQAAADEQNARLADEQAKDAVRRGSYEEVKLRRSMSLLEGGQRAALAASGVDVDSGSALDVQEASRLEGERDAAVLRMNAQREAWGYQAQAVNYRNAASAARASGRNAMTGAVIGAGTSLLTAASPYFGAGAGTGATAAGAGTSPAWMANFSEMRGQSMSAWERSWRRARLPR